ncbi:transcription initiation factor TFIID subunit 12 [Nematocida minor]|uniref:transcription initiation factor TFIID subunit 12 n=1 Tax=Nematocida minor TaxID=1912983 RepID=UPI0022211406|nr:transcription initiation factor TFIID subunit 12 [Nematocida minor]KAI5190968.1 transcription initiation factor TFIID subunit 12 [Nematocida minor]
MKEQNLQKKIQHLQSMLGEINRYLQGSASKPPGMISRLLDEKTRLTSQLRELNNMFIGKSEEQEGQIGNMSSAYSVAGKMEKGREYPHTEPQYNDPLDKRIDIDDILLEMGIKTGADESSKRILLSGADIFIDNLISTACSVARNKNMEEITKEEILFALLMERKTELYNRGTTVKHRDPDKEHTRRLQMIKKDQKRYLGNE